MKARRPVENPQLTRPDWLKESPRDPGLLWLDKNENTDPKLQAFTLGLLKDLDPTTLFTYPELKALYQKIGQLDLVDPSQLLLTAGSDGGIRMVFEAYVSEGDCILHTAPTFAMYPVYSMIYGAKAVRLEYARTPKGPILTPEQVVSALHEHRPKVLFLPNPDSPTGTVFAPKNLETILTAALQTDTLVLIDEAYYPFYPQTVVPWVSRFKNLVVARTFSKAWGLAGLRTGYLVANKEVSLNLHKVRPMYEINTVAVNYLEKMLDHESQVKESVARNNAGKIYFNQEMNRLGFKTLETHGNFTHVEFGSQQEKIVAGLKDLVLFRADFKDECLRGYSRFSVAPQEVMQKVVTRIETLAGRVQQ